MAIITDSPRSQLLHLVLPSYLAYHHDEASQLPHSQWLVIYLYRVYTRARFDAIQLHDSQSVSF